MTGTDDDLVDMLTPPAPGPSMDWRYRQGVVNSFNATTYENVVAVGGTTFVNLPCINISAAEATVLATTVSPAVALALIVSDRGTSILAIVGRLVTP